MKESWKRALVAPAATVQQAIRAIDQSRIQIALVVDEGERLLGTVTDGDVRRALLRGVDVNEPVSAIMNAHPTTVHADEPSHRVLDLMKRTTLRCIPRLDAEGAVVGVSLLEDFLQPEDRDNMVVIMAGGLGTRLNPITQAVPKPLLRVGAKPILETILDNFREFGFRNFFFSVNYKADMVKEHFGDGSRWGVRIRYLEERRPLGTAGSLSLLPERPTKAVLVMNGDLLTKVNFEHLLDFHREHSAAATMCVREYDFQVPFGVVRLENQRIVAIDEKPLHRFFVNAGIYVLEPEALALVPADTTFDMTMLFERLIEKNWHASVFPVREYWLDVGRLDDLEQARIDFANPGDE